MKRSVLIIAVLSAAVLSACGHKGRETGRWGIEGRETEGREIEERETDSRETERRETDSRAEDVAAAGSEGDVQPARPSIIPEDKNEDGATDDTGAAALLAAVEAASGRQMEHHVYVDMDHDGKSELIGVCRDETEIYQTWYCGSDGADCRLVHQNDLWLEECAIGLLDLGRETHVVVNAYNMMGTSKNYTILALWDKEIHCILSNQYGYVSMQDSGDITLDVEAYDGMYEPTINGYIMHTWKDTYLFFDGKTYKEYGATQIPEEAFLQFSRAADLKKSIARELTQPDTVEIQFTYYIRANGILHIQCAVCNTLGNIEYQYYTVRYSGQEIAGGLGEPNYGQMEPYFSNLEVVY